MNAPFPDAHFFAGLRAGYIERFPHMAECGLRVAAIAADGATLELPAREEWIGDSGSGRLNPGIISVLVDSAAGLAVLAALGRIERIATLDLRMDYLRPAFAGTPVRCRAHCRRLTRSIAFVGARVWQGDERETVADAQLVFMRSSLRRAAERRP